MRLAASWKACLSLFKYFLSLQLALLKCPLGELRGQICSSLRLQNLGEFFLTKYWNLALQGTPTCRIARGERTLRQICASTRRRSGPRVAIVAMHNWEMTRKPSLQHLQTTLCNALLIVTGDTVIESLILAFRVRARMLSTVVDFTE